MTVRTPKPSIVLRDIPLMCTVRDCFVMFGLFNVRGHEYPRFVICDTVSLGKRIRTFEENSLSSWRLRVQSTCYIKMLPAIVLFCILILFYIIVFMAVCFVGFCLIF
jgi:hypothetical protein